MSDLVRRLRARIDELEETVRQLREQRQAVMLPDWSNHLSTGERLVLAMLWPGREVGRETLLDALYPAGNYPESYLNIVRVFVCHIRKALPKGYGLRAIYGRGYQLIHPREELRHAA